MKFLKLFSMLLITFFAIKNCLNASHLATLQSKNLIGVAPNSIHNPSSVTLRGQLLDGNQTIIGSSSTWRGTVTSTSGFVGDGRGLTNLPAGSLSGGGTTYAAYEGTRLSTLSIITGGVTTYAPALATANSTATIFTGGVTTYAPALAVANSTATIFTGGVTTYAPALAVANSTASIFTGGVTTYAPALAVANATNTILTGGATVYISSGSQTVQPFHLQNTAVTPGTYGSATLIPQITADADGRITEIAEITSAAGALRKTFTITVGTLNAISSEVDIASNTEDGFTEAKRRLGMLGLTYGTTAQGDIFYKEGVYNFTVATVPAGCRLRAVKGSSTVITIGNLSATTFINYGTIDGFTIDGGSRALAADIVVMKSGGIVKNVHLTGVENLRTGSPDGALFSWFGTSNTLLDDIEIDETEGLDGLAINGDNAPFKLNNSSLNVLNNIKLTKYGLASNSAADCFIGIINSGLNTISNSNFKESGGKFIILNGSSRNRIIHNTLYMTMKSDAGDGALMVFDSAGGAGQGVVSTGTVFSNNTIYVNPYGSASFDGVIFRSDADATNNVNGVLYENNKIIGLAPTGVSGFALSANTNVTILTGNKVWLISGFLSDSGNGTRYTTLGNFFNSVQQ